MIDGFNVYLCSLVLSLLHTTRRMMAVALFACGLPLGRRSNRSFVFGGRTFDDVVAGLPHISSLPEWGPSCPPPKKLKQQYCTVATSHNSYGIQLAGDDGRKDGPTPSKARVGRDVTECYISALPTVEVPKLGLFRRRERRSVRRWKRVVVAAPHLCRFALFQLVFQVPADIG